MPRSLRVFSRASPRQEVDRFTRTEVNCAVWIKRSYLLSRCVQRCETIAIAVQKRICWSTTMRIIQKERKRALQVRTSRWWLTRCCWFMKFGEIDPATNHLHLFELYFSMTSSWNIGALGNRIFRKSTFQWVFSKILYEPISRSRKKLHCLNAHSWRSSRRSWIQEFFSASRFFLGAISLHWVFFAHSSLWGLQLRGTMVWRFNSHVSVLYCECHCFLVFPRDPRDRSRHFMCIRDRIIHRHLHARR